MKHRLHRPALPSGLGRPRPARAPSSAPSSGTPAATQSAERYSALLLFEFLVTYSGVPGIRRLCEERLVVFTALSARRALAEARRYGRHAQLRYTNPEGGKVAFRFVGVLDLLHLGVECGPEEVWYAIREYVRPMERRHQILPPEHALSAIRQERAV